jgi:hypothetical protein
MTAALAIAVGGVAAPPAQAGRFNLTVYNRDLALVRDSRTLDLEKGTNEIRLADVAALIDPTSVHLEGEGLQVLEQNFEYDLASADRILERYLGQTVTAVLEGGEAFTGTLMSYGGELVLVTDRGAQVISRQRMDRIDFPELPGGLTTRPTLVWQAEAGSAGDVPATLSYLTGGMQWHAEYVALVSDDETALELSAWVSVENNSGATYEDARLQLVAGDVHRAEPEFMPFDGRGRVASMAAKPEFEEEAFFEYHLYTLDRPATVKDRQTKQLTLFPTAQVADVKKVYRFRGGKKVKVMLEFRNSQSGGLGLPLPMGKLRVFKKDSKGGAQFVGEDRIDHTPKDEKVEVFLGSAFDISAERTVLDHQQITRSVVEETIEVKVRNHKEEAVEVLVEETIYGDWQIMSASHAWEKESAYKVVFKLPVERDGETVLKYTYRRG